MNVIITMPAELICEILEGRKTIEARKTIPTRLNENTDWVYVCCAGQRKVMVAFQVSKFQRTNDGLGVWSKLGGKIRCHYAWWVEYTKDKRTIFFWHITNVHAIELQTAAWLNLVKDKNPQSFKYTNITLDESWFK